MRSFASNQDFYDQVVAWTTSTELFGELGLAMLKMGKQSTLPPAVQIEIEDCIVAVEMLLPDLRRLNGL